MSIFVGIPTYDGTVCIDTVRTLLDEQALALAAGVSLQVTFLPGCSLIPMARNQLVKAFLDSGCERLVFVDADVSWEPGDLLRLASHDRDLVGGAYRLKDEVECYPVQWRTEADLWVTADGLIPVDGLPTGFLAVRRAVFEKLAKAYPRPYSHYGHEFQAFFQNPYLDGRLYGEDTLFCKEWRDIGGDVLLDPRFTMTHVDGKVRYTGCVGDWLKSGAGGKMEDPLTLAAE